MSKIFSKKNAQKYVVVHRPHDDPEYYNDDAHEHVLVPVGNPKPRPRQKVRNGSSNSSRPVVNEHVGEAALYGIAFDDSKYDYTQHLKPIGLDPENSVFVPADKVAKPKKNIEDLFVEPAYRNPENATNSSMFERGVAKPEYLSHQQDIPEDIKGFKPDINPSLREVLEALEDEAYVVNDDVIVTSKGEEEANDDDDDDDVFAQLLESGQAEKEEEEEDFKDEWDVDNLDRYEEEQYQEEMAQFDNIENLEDLQDIDYQADVRRFQRERAHSRKEVEEEDIESVEPAEDEEADTLGDLPNVVSQKKKRKERRKKGAMSDVSGFSMTSSAIARTETMTILDDKYDQVIAGYENYEEEQEADEDAEYQPFDMANERSDFESLLDDFLDNYELDTSGRKLLKKDAERDRLKQAADEVSKGKLSARRRRLRQVDNDGDPLARSFNKLQL